jgi:hypothetical protein
LCKLYLRLVSLVVSYRRDFGSGGQHLVMMVSLSLRV